jgi:hypothetical protein
MAQKDLWKLNLEDEWRWRLVAGYSQSCPICFVDVHRAYREDHIKWHEDLENGRGGIMIEN